MPNNPNVFYVYVLFDWRGVPRWVGKGKGRRWLDHERSSDPVNWRKNEFIEQTWIMLDDIPKLKIQENLSEKEAFNLEILLIQLIGRSDQGKGPLINLTNGGEGMAGIRQPSGKALAARNAAVSRGHRRRTREEIAASNALRALNYPSGYWSEKAKVNWGKLSDKERKEFSLRGLLAALAAGNHHWINNGKINRRVKNTDNLQNGWRVGRLHVPSSKCTDWVSGTIWINNGNETKRISKNDKIPNGWNRGRVTKEDNYCKCGCGKIIGPDSIYSRGHYPRS